MPETMVEQPAQPLHVVASPSLFCAPTKRITETVPPGATLLDLVLQTGMGAWREDGVVHLPGLGRVMVAIDGHVVDRDFWHKCRPKPGTLVEIYLVPQNQRQGIIIGASILIAVAAIFTGGLAAGAYGPLAGGVYAGSTAAFIAGAAASAAVSIGGSHSLSTFPPLTVDQ